MWLFDSSRSQLSCVSQNSGNAGRKGLRRSPNNLNADTTYKVETTLQIYFCVKVLDKQQAGVGFMYSQEFARLELEPTELEELFERGDCVAQQPVDCSFTTTVGQLILEKRDDKVLASLDQPPQPDKSPRYRSIGDVFGPMTHMLETIAYNHDGKCLIQGMQRSCLLQEIVMAEDGSHKLVAKQVKVGCRLAQKEYVKAERRYEESLMEQIQYQRRSFYTDFGTTIRRRDNMEKSMQICEEMEERIKLEIFWPSCNGTKLREGLFPVDIRRPSLGVKLLGGAASRDAYFISGLALRRAVNAVDLMKKATLFFDKGLRGSIENIVVYGGPFFGDLQWSLASLPIRFGGLGLYSAKVVSSYAFVASRAQSWVLQDHILRDSGICGMDVDYASALACLRDTIPSFDFNIFTNKDTAPSKAQQILASALSSEMIKDMEVRFDMIVRQKAVFECLRAPHAHDFLLAILIDGFGQHMSPVEYRTILKYRLMIPLFPVDAICPVCRKACLDFFGEHAVHCKELPGFKYRHDMVRDVLFDICRHAGISVKKEAPAALKAVSCKVTKHEKACIENQHVFIPFAFDTFGFLAPEAVELLTRVQRVMNSNVMTPRSIIVVFTRIGFTIQKGLAAQLVVRLPSPTM
ncbi:hypothetical protein Tco_1135794 [Tanacetum coccineum]